MDGASGRRQMKVKVTRNPERTSEQILKAATEEFTEHGFAGARVDAIAARAGINKRMLYHYYGNKDDLFLAVMENAYAEIRSHEHELELDRLDPVAAVRELVNYTFNYFVDKPSFIRLLNTENLHEARHIKRSKRIPEMHSPLIVQIERVLARGAAAGVFRTDVDPVQLYISIASLGYFYLSNIHTLATIFDKDLHAPRALADRLAHIEDVVIGYLRP
jgi:AcrR family transcriptional regulator